MCNSADRSRVSHWQKPDKGRRSVPFQNVKTLKNAITGVLLDEGALTLMQRGLYDGFRCLGISSQSSDQPNVTFGVN